jgi:hypothetical protein
MPPITVRLGFVPALRFCNKHWIEKMRADSLAAFTCLPEVKIIAPQVAPAGAAREPLTGSTPFGMVNILDQVEAVSAYFRSCQVDVLTMPVRFGDEHSAVKIAEQVGMPVQLDAIWVNVKDDSQVMWLWAAHDASTKLIPVLQVGGRSDQQ